MGINSFISLANVFMHADVSHGGHSTELYNEGEITKIAFVKEKKMLSVFLRSGWFMLRNSYDKGN